MTARQNLFKRCFDAAVAAVGLMLLMPVALAIAVMVKLTSSGPVLFTQQRVGRHGRLFLVLKFRTMAVDAQCFGTVTKAGDPRITRLGKVLRTLKLDEVPQLCNVLTGHMSLVGPRPDVPGYGDRLDGEARKTLTVRPGITGPATLFFRNEEELLARAADPQRYNDEVIYPVKVRLNLEYVQRWSFWRDLGYILVTVCPPLDRWLKLVPRNIPLPTPEEYDVQAQNVPQEPPP